MFEAELHHKLPELRAHEDYFTSCIFGALKYLPPNDVLFPILNASFNYRLNTSLENHLKIQNRELGHFDKVQFHFWPRSLTYGEPDLVITLEGTLGSFLIPMEIKYFSEKHGEKEEDQLRRYYIALGTVEGRRTFNQEVIRQFSGGMLAFIYLTQFVAEREIEETIQVLEAEGIKDAENKFFHLTWQEIASTLELLLLREREPHKKAIYSDIKELMTFRNLMPFKQFSQLPTQLPPELLFKSPVFFQSGDIKSEGFKHFPDLPKQLLPEMLSHFPVFLYSAQSKEQHLFSGFPRIPKNLRLEYKANIYYGGSK